jgi:hypothetical protein
MEANMLEQRIKSVERMNESKKRRLHQIDQQRLENGDNVVEPGKLFC